MTGTFINKESILQLKERSLNKIWKQCIREAKCKRGV